ncbi:adenosylcobinamide-phosphate synthase CbiB [Brevibacillus marinus]|uniref:adenosylcobinamide-phosphate synthase CbiB n=1 Tax=Brevibacillus marinus TaxID=2496837 RepID=UPI000F84A966|nr:adenosylcobinamide-phosphate synthase CbiB [Brevibacillus marinus]
MNPLLAVQAALAYLLDLLIGDPRWLPHPVVGMGKLAAGLERLVRPGYAALSPEGKRRKYGGRLLGLLFPLVVGGSSWLFAWCVVQAAANLHGLLAAAVEVYLISTTIATKGLAEAGRAIYGRLAAGDLPGARQELSQVVGRDTERLDEREVTRGAVETVAENIVDAVTAPLFFALLGGAPLAFFYRAVNTLDSMVGYNNERYRHLGWASARLDDLLNWLPARLTFLVMVPAAWLLRMDARGAWKIGRRDAGKHPSPNSGWAEAAVAGALRVQLGGTNYYQGVPSHRALLGDPEKPLAPVHILQAVRLLYLTTALFCGAGTIARCLFAALFA